MPAIRNDTADKSYENQTLDQIHDDPFVLCEKAESEYRAEKTEERQTTRNRRSRDHRTDRTNLVQNVSAHRKKTLNFIPNARSPLLPDIPPCRRVSSIRLH